MSELVHSLATVKHAQIQMFELREAVLQQILLGAYELLPLVHALLEEDGGRLVLKACHLERLHNCLVLAGRSACLAVCVEADDLNTARLISKPTIFGAVLNFVLDRDLRTRPQLLYKVA